MDSTKKEANKGTIRIPKKSIKGTRSEHEPRKREDMTNITEKPEESSEEEEDAKSQESFQRARVSKK
jgi:hypothetical protein